MSLRERLLALADGRVDSKIYGDRNLAITAAQIALTEYAEMMERANQPAAALGASLLATKLGKP